LKIYDVSTPVNPNPSGSYLSASPALGVYKSGNYAYVVSGYYIYDAVIFNTILESAYTSVEVLYEQLYK